MSSGGLLLLLGLLTLWAELTPISGQDRPERRSPSSAAVGHCAEEDGSPARLVKVPDKEDFQEEERLGQKSFAHLGPAYPLGIPKLVQAHGTGSITNEETLPNWNYCSNLTQRPFFSPGPPRRPSPKPHPGFIPSSLQ
ncbi:putative serine protease inhibitor 473 protein [Naja naja]|nr:putative serine protease inhibitor 473 protein [Naja naja]